MRNSSLLIIPGGCRGKRLAVTSKSFLFRAALGSGCTKAFGQSLVRDARPRSYQETA